MKGILRVFPDEHKMAAAAMLKWSGIAVEAVSLRKSCTMVLAGGSTPRALYRLAATADPALFPWASTHVFLGDERFVPEESPEAITA
jgi:6-phosphogluconolactonase